MKRIQILRRHDKKKGEMVSSIFTEVLMVLMGLENTGTGKDQELIPVSNK
jgi:hypothetical protein